MAYYAVLAAKGFIGAERAARLWRVRLAARPASGPQRLVPGAEISSGSLGHGLPLAVGTALGLRAAGLTRPRVFVLVGDGELDEGSNHEAIAFAGRAGSGQLHRGRRGQCLGQHGWPGGIETRFGLEGWSAARADGRDHAALEAGAHRAAPGPAARRRRRDQRRRGG